MRKEVQKDGGGASEHSHSYYFLSEKAVKRLPYYQYKGQDQSLLYGYVLSPLASFCVQNLTPRWLAPNAITLVGLLFMIAAYSVVWVFSPDLEPSPYAPRWIFLFVGIALLTYQTLDNMDGKQSRRTNSSSPLGLLFDHGCDAINPLFGSVNWIVSMALSPVADTRLCFIILFGPYAMFYVGTWEEYYTGELIMPIVNGPSEGLLGGALVSFTSFLYGPEYWLQTSWWSNWLAPSFSAFAPSAFGSMPALRNADILMLASAIGVTQEIFLKATFVARTYGAKTLLNLLPLATLITSAVAVGHTDLSIWISCPRVSLHLCAVLFTEMTVDLMLCHMSEEKYRPFRWPLAPLVLFTIMVCTGLWTSGELTQNYLLSYSSALGAYLCLKLAILVNEICHLLEIWCFDIITPRCPQSARSGEPKLC